MKNLMGPRTTALLAAAAAASYGLGTGEAVAAFAPPMRPPTTATTTTGTTTGTTTSAAATTASPAAFWGASPDRRRSATCRRHPLGPLFLGADDEDEEDDEDVPELSDDGDWRDFRARLVMGENKEKREKKKKAAEEGPVLEEDDFDGIGAVFASKATAADESENQDEDEDEGEPFAFTPLDPSQWAYDSGKVIERGAVILGGVEQDFGFALRQQYFHKAAILVLDHDEARFTKGIILNRPSDRYLADDVNGPGVRWRVWFGGDVQGLDSTIPDIVCLHSLKDDAVVDVSIPVMKDIQWTTFENAKKLVKIGAAKPSDFWLFAGYAGWGPGQLMGELDRSSWYMVATDSQTLLKELARQSATVEPRDAGLDTWTLLMNMIGRGETAEESSGHFDDLMLKEWAREKLLDEEGESAVVLPPAEAAPEGPAKYDPIGDLYKRAASDARGDPAVARPVPEGTVVRASSSDRSPFLLRRQEYHKSVVLVVSDDDGLTVGVMLNHPAAKALEMEIIDKSGGGERRTVKIPLRYGGEYAVKGQSPLLWLHCDPALRKAGVGSPFGGDDPSPAKGGVYKCSQEEATSAIGRGTARPEDFIVVSGVSVWTKGGGAGGAGGVGIGGGPNFARGMEGEVAEGKFEVVPADRTQEVWEKLRTQEVLTKLNIAKNLAIGDEAWSAGGGGGGGGGGSGTQSSSSRSSAPPLTSGIGEGHEEEDDSYVYGSDTRVSDLSDKALRSWVATFLLGAPSLGA